MYHVFFQDRESQNWYYKGTTGVHRQKAVKIGRKVLAPSFLIYDNYIYPKPTKSAFVSDYKIITAESEAEAWQILNSTYQKVK